MKKSLLALAVLGAFAATAQAQSSVTITGNVDMGYQSLSRDNDADVQGIDNDGSSTSNIYFSGTEDLGGGLKAGFLYGTNINVGGKDNSFGDAQNYLSLGGGFGLIKAGNINTQVMAASSASQPFGTAIGSGYSGDFSRLNSVTVSDTVSAAGALGGRPIRTGNSVYYTSPSFGGFGVTAGMSVENDEGANTAGMQEFALSYKANALNAIVAFYRTTVGDNALTTGTGAALTTILPADSEIEQLVVGANYTFGPATVYAGYSQSDADDVGVDVDSTSYNIAGKYKITPAVALMANFVQVTDDSAAEADRELLGLGVDYSLSKRTVAYVRYETTDVDASELDYDQYALGLRHSF